MTVGTLRAAVAADVARLDRIALRAKAHWGYADEQLAAWAADLRVPPGSLATHPTVVAEVEGRVVAFGQLDPGRDPWELTALWVLPEHMGRGIGRRLLGALLAEAAAAGQGRVHVDADPYALAFYLACGAELVGEVAAPIAGDPDRRRPQLRLATRGA